MQIGQVRLEAQRLVVCCDRLAGASKSLTMCPEDLVGFRAVALQLKRLATCILRDVQPAEREQRAGAIDVVDRCRGLQCDRPIDTCQATPVGRIARRYTPEHVMAVGMSGGGGDDLPVDLSACSGACRSCAGGGRSGNVPRLRASVSADVRPPAISFPLSVMVGRDPTICAAWPARRWLGQVRDTRGPTAMDARLMSLGTGPAARPGAFPRLPELWLFTDARRLPDPRRRRPDCRVVLAAWSCAMTANRAARRWGVTSRGSAGCAVLRWWLRAMSDWRRRCGPAFIFVPGAGRARCGVVMV